MSYFSKSKRIIIPIIVIILLIYSLIFIDLKWWGPQEPISFISLIFFTGMILLFDILMILFINSFLKESITKLKYHLVVKALINKKYINLFFNFPLTIIFEELIFRLYIFTVFYSFFGLIFALVFSSLIFGLYHLHIWLEFKEKRITYSFILISVFLGFILGGLLYYFGILICIIVHFSTVLVLFYIIKLKLTHGTID